MKNKELIEYLQTFPEKAEVSFIVGDPKTRKVYPTKECACITDMDCPVFMITVGPAENMDEENLKHCDLEGQMNITDFPEVLP